MTLRNTLHFIPNGLARGKNFLKKDFEEDEKVHLQRSFITLAQNVSNYFFNFLERQNHTFLDRTFIFFTGNRLKQFFHIFQITGTSNQTFQNFKKIIGF